MMNQSLTQDAMNYHVQTYGDRKDYVQAQFYDEIS